MGEPKPVRQHTLQLEYRFDRGANPKSPNPISGVNDEQASRPDWVFQDEGYSGAILVRPGLDALRDLAAEGQIAAALIYSPDRLSRKYAYQVLWSEELARCGVELIFLKAPAGATPEVQMVFEIYTQQ